MVYEFMGCIEPAALSLISPFSNESSVRQFNLSDTFARNNKMGTEPLSGSIMSFHHEMAQVMYLLGAQVN